MNGGNRVEGSEGKGKEIIVERRKASKDEGKDQTDEEKTGQKEGNESGKRNAVREAEENRKASDNEANERGG